VNFTAPYDPPRGTGFASIQLAEVQLYEPELGINDVAFNANQLTIYPNPARDLIQVETTGNQFVRNIEVIDILENVITAMTTSTATQQQQLIVESLTSGVYFVRVSSDNGTVTKR